MEGLLEIIGFKSEDELRRFYEENKEIFEKVEIGKDDSLSQARLLALTSLDCRSSQLPFEVIAKALQIPMEEVQIWAVKAMMAGLWTAKIDELKNCVVVSHCKSLMSYSSTEDWSSLHEKLSTWRDGISTLLEKLEKPTAGKTE